MALIATGIALLWATVVLILLVRRADSNAREGMTRQADDWSQLMDGLGRIAAGVDASAMALRTYPAPPDFTFLESFVAEQSRLLRARMDTINEQHAILTTRVETGPGKRTINFP